MHGSASRSRRAVCPDDVFGVFTATFLPDEKVKKLERLPEGHMKGVATTSALAMGIDIGSLSCSILAGYPGSIAKTWQMLGRAGRRGPGLQLFLVGESFMDQYWAKDPAELLDQDKHLDEIIIAPDNEEILRDHILTAHYDHPLAVVRDREFFGPKFEIVLTVSGRWDSQSNKPWRWADPVRPRPS